MAEPRHVIDDFIGESPRLFAAIPPNVTSRAEQIPRVPSYKPAFGAASAVNGGVAWVTGANNLDGASEPYNGGRKARAADCIRE